jgi:hypothetical protein
VSAVTEKEEAATRAQVERLATELAELKAHLMHQGIDPPAPIGLDHQ